MKITHNSSEKEYIFREKNSQIDCFHQIKHSLTLHLQDEADITYAVFLENAHLTLNIIAEKNAVKGQIFAFIPAQKNSRASLNVQTHLQSSHAKVHIHLIAIQDEGAEVNMQGNITIAPNVEKVVGHLLEEVVLLGKAKHISLQPILNVASPDVQASHGARVHRIPLEKLFYMQSRGLSASAALKMIVDALVEQILGNFQISKAEKEEINQFLR
ncbi:MAG: SufD family Fe-S cluster assembly protein [Candidatus Peribacteria bacterium]|jgi:Fe-S cluster assembly scaffold protein SufB|nr:SufD family Fe-S cluster assembly protein [Candidatus Peribacteria bacterium]